MFQEKVKKCIWFILEMYWEGLGKSKYIMGLEDFWNFGKWGIIWKMRLKISIRCGVVSQGLGIWGWLYERQKDLILRKEKRFGLDELVSVRIIIGNWVFLM